MTENRNPALDTTPLAAQASERPGAGWLAAGGLAGGALASSCCLLPLALFGLGLSGAWIGNLAALAPYQPVFILLGVGFLGLGFWRAYFRPQAVCASAASDRVVKIGLWSAALLIAAAMAFPFAAPFLLSS